MAKHQALAATAVRAVYDDTAESGKLYARQDESARHSA